MSITDDGRKAEALARELLNNAGYANMFQPDWIVPSKTNGYVMLEVKKQARFEPPPFEGHGLPYWQVKARIEFQLTTGVRAALLIIEKETSAVFWQYLDVLEKGEHYDTKGSSPRRVYPLDSFLLWPIWQF